MSLIKVFNFTTCLMVMAGALSLAVAEESLTYTTIILVGVITSYFWVEEKKVFYLSERLKTPLTIIYLLFAFLDMSLFSRSFVMTLAHLLLLIQLTKLLGKKSDGDYFQIYLISLALLIVAAVITVELYFFFFFIVCLNFKTAKFNSMDVSVSLVCKSSSKIPAINSPLLCMSAF